MDIWLKQRFCGKIAAVLNISVFLSKNIFHLVHCFLLLIYMNENLKISEGKVHLSVSKTVVFLHLFMCS